MNIFGWVTKLRDAINFKRQIPETKITLNDDHNKTNDHSKTDKTKSSKLSNRIKNFFTRKSYSNLSRTQQNQLDALNKASFHTMTNTQRKEINR